MDPQTPIRTSEHVEETRGTALSRGTDFTRAVAALEGSALLTPDEVARRCALNRKAIYRAIDRGELAAYRVCSRLRVRPADVEEWVNGGRVAGQPLAPTPRRAAYPAARGLRTMLPPSGGTSAR